jgi:hypothetical protein
LIVTATILVSVYKIAFIFYILIFHFNKWIRIRIRIRINQLHERHPPDDFACISRFMLNRLVAFMGAATATVAAAATVALSAGCDAGGTSARRLSVNANA